MVKTHYLLLLVVILSACTSNQPKVRSQNNDENLDEMNIIQDEVVETTPSVYELILEKQPQLKSGYPNGIDISFNDERSFYSLEEVKRLRLDTLKLKINERYVLSTQSFLEENDLGIESEIYFYQSYPYMLSKHLRVFHGDNMQDLVLSATHGDGQSGKSIQSEFNNDSTFIQIIIEDETVKDNPYTMAYQIDSIAKEYRFDDHLHFTLVRCDTFSFYRETVRYIDDYAHTTFNVWSSPFKMNAANVRWEYEVKYAHGVHEESKEIMVDIVRKNLIDLKSNDTLLTDSLSLYVYLAPIHLGWLDYHSVEKNMFDVNFDGFDDFQIMTEGSSSGNQMFAVYLYQPENHKYQYSQEFSGHSLSEEGIELYPHQKMALYSGKGGGGLYGFTKKYVGANSQILYSEHFHNDITKTYVQTDSGEYNMVLFHYEKMKNDTLVMHKTDTMYNKEGDFGLNQFYDWFEEHE